jgi:hypothetical protein
MRSTHQATRRRYSTPRMCTHRAGSSARRAVQHTCSGV